MVTAVGTQDGIVFLDGLADGGGREQQRALDGRSVNHLAMRDGRTIAAVAGDGLYAIEPDGAVRQIWEGDARSCAISPARDLYVGLEPAMIVRSSDDGASWQWLSAIDELPTRESWTFPPPPHEPHVLSIDFAPGAPDRMMAGIEVGGVIWSDDGGDTWEERSDGIYVDVHSLRPAAAAGRLYAVTGNGFYASEDDGQQWERRMHGMDQGYTIGLACHPERSGEVFVSSGDRPPGVNARLYHTTDGGRTWRELATPPAGVAGAASVPFYAGGAPHIGDRDGGIYRLDDAPGTWEPVARVDAAVTCVYSDGVASSVMH